MEELLKNSTDFESKSVPSATSAVPCLYSSISTEKPEIKTFEFSTARKHSAFVLAQSVEQIVQSYGIEFIGFLTLTFKDHVTCPKEAQRRLNSLFRHVVKPRYTDYVGVFERTKRGRIHYHLLVALPFDAKTGFNFDQVANAKLPRNIRYQSVSPQLKAEWSFLRKTVVKYQFGPRVELKPIRNNVEAIKYYVGKYIGKSLQGSYLQGDDRDKGVRLVRYSKGARAGTTKFVFLSDGSRKWRDALGFFAELVSDYFGKPVTDITQLKDILSSYWAHK